MGARRPFSWFFDGESKVQVNDIEAVCTWLDGCEYVSDQELFREPDFWQHPLTFEQIRRGDCEDHALWAWRKLSELGIEARFFLGRTSSAQRTGRMHAWVGLVTDGQELVLEGTARRGTPLKPSDSFRQEYIPHFSVGREYDIRVYGGYADFRARMPRHVYRGKRTHIIGD